MAEVININQTKTLAQKAVEDEIRRTETRVSYYNLRKEAFDPVISELESNLPISVSLDSGSVDFAFAGTKEQLKKAIGVMRKHGFDSDTRPKQGETSFSAYWRNDAGHRLWISFSSTQCRRVQTGTKTVEQPVYEVICD